MGRSLESQSLRVAYKNRAPTPEHQSHHVYGVYLAPFSAEPFQAGESIGGGHAEMGGSQSYTLAALLARPKWRHHFELSGCTWAVPLIEAGSHNERALLDALVNEVCRREGAAAA